MKRQMPSSVGISLRVIPLTCAGKATILLLTERHQTVRSRHPKSIILLDNVGPCRRERSEAKDSIAAVVSPPIASRAVERWQKSEALDAYMFEQYDYSNSRGPPASFTLINTCHDGCISSCL